MPENDQSRRSERIHWGTAALLLALHCGLFSAKLVENTAVPHSDPAVHLTKVYLVAEQGSATLFSHPHNERGHLPILAAARLLGKEADPRHVGLLWLLMRMLALLLALRLLSRLAQSSRFVPIAAAAILASPLQTNLNPHAYTMDSSFQCFGLLAFAATLWDIKRLSPLSAGASAAAALALCLIKPMAPAFLAPAYLLLGLRALTRLREVRRAAAWIAPYALLAGCLIFLYLSPHGLCVKQQYLRGLQGCWWTDLSGWSRVRFAAQMLPPWLGLLALIGIRRAPAKLLLDWWPLGAAATLAWWYLFSGHLVYTVTPRIMAAAMPVAACAAALFASRTRRLARGAYACAALAFAATWGIAWGWLPPSRNAALGAYLGFRPQPIPRAAEIGLLPLAAAVRLEIEKSDPDAHAVLTPLFHDFLADYMSLTLAFRYASGHRWPPIPIRSSPWDVNDCDLGMMLKGRWFLTKLKRKTGEPHRPQFACLHALDRLITDPHSPLRPYLRKRLELPLHQPGLEDLATLWHLREIPPPGTLKKILLWLRPQLFASEKGRAMLQKRLDSIPQR